MVIAAIHRNFNRTLKLLHTLSHSSTKSRRLSQAWLTRTYSSTESCNSIKKVVYISNSKNIFENLALEEWLYDNVDMDNTDYLLMWNNGPAIVTGRHQNTWLECDTEEAVKRDILIARRSSGGGTVYHDEGNLNLSFLMHRSRYDRRKNLSLVVAAVTGRWDLDLGLNCRDDLVLDGVYKVSGTASKLGGKRTYHHFTLVFDMEKDVLDSILHSPLVGTNSNATKSVPSLVKNLKEDAPDMTYETLIKVIGHHFMRTEEDKSFTMVDPTDESKFPGILTKVQRLASWDWVFSKTPPFSITHTFVKSVLDAGIPYCQYSLETRVKIEKGKISNFFLALSGRLKENGTDVDLPFRLLNIVDVVGALVEEKELNALWETCERRVRWEKKDVDLLMWGLECVKKCVPIGYGPVAKS